MNRRKVIVAGLGAVVAEVVASAWHPVPVYIGCLASAAVLLVAAVIAGWRRNGQPPAAFLVDEHDRSFRTPVHANGLLLCLASLQLIGFLLALTQETWLGLVGGLFFGGILAGTWRAYWRGAGLTLRPSGIEAGKAAGALMIPWEALAPEPPGRGENWGQLKLAYARPELVAATGWTLARDEVVFEGANPDFVAKAIATYADEPDRRHAIGTLAELKRLQEDQAARPPGILEMGEPAPTRTTVRRLIVALVLLAVSIPVAAAAGQGWLRLLVSPLGWFGGHQFYLAVTGWRAARRAQRGAAESPCEAAPRPVGGHDVSTADYVDL
ncbi:hypothetical protein ABZ807_17925 [Micromonospora sp. NPDC047548]|uniref:hypothetical protein n=1 Tax=Micromonospora sp. NPDC047548 TaxID=3155624 RepID=UPI0033DB7C35